MSLSIRLSRDFCGFKPMFLRPGSAVHPQPHRPQAGIVGVRKLAAPGHGALVTAFWPCQNRVVPYGQPPRYKAPVAQLDRATVYGTVGYTFEPCRVHASGRSTYEEPRINGFRFGQHFSISTFGSSSSQRTALKFKEADALAKAKGS